MPRKISFVEKTLSEKTIFKGRIFRIVRQRVRLPDRNTSTRDLIFHPGAVAMIPVDSKGNIVLVRQYRKAVEKTLLEIPAGTLDPGESLRKCAQRELQEEIGYRAGRITKLMSFYPAAGYTSEEIHIYVATKLVRSTAQHDLDEFLEVVPMRPKAILREIYEGRIKDSKTIVGLLTYLQA